MDMPIVPAWTRIITDGKKGNGGTTGTMNSTKGPCPVGGRVSLECEVSDGRIRVHNTAEILGTTLGPLVQAWTRRRAGTSLSEKVRRWSSPRIPVLLTN